MATRFIVKMNIGGGEEDTIETIKDAVGEVVAMAGLEVIGDVEVTEES